MGAHHGELTHRDLFQVGQHAAHELDGHQPLAGLTDIRHPVLGGVRPIDAETEFDDIVLDLFGQGVPVVAFDVGCELKKEKQQIVSRLENLQIIENRPG